MFLILLVGKVYGQETEKSRIYETRSNIAAIPCDVIGTKIYTDNRFEVPPYRARFAVVRTLKDTLVVRFLTWYVNPSSPRNKEPTTTNTSSSTLATTANDLAKSYRERLNDAYKLDETDPAVHKTIKKQYSGRDNLVVRRYFLIAKNDLDSNCVKVFTSGWNSATFTLGVVTMPTKLRLGQNFDFQGNLSLGTTAGAKFRLSPYNPNFINLLLGLSLSTVSLDSFSTGGRIKGQPLSNIAVFSPSLGAVFEFGKAQVGVFYGYDLLNKSTQSKYEWIYDRKPWLSIGFGFSIFSIDSKISGQNIKQTSVKTPASPEPIPNSPTTGAKEK